MNIFLDTNIFLECVPIEQIDFLALSGEEGVLVVVPRVTISELDKIKYDQNSKRKRARSKAALVRIEKYSNEGEQLRKGVNLKLMMSIPKIDFNKHNLNSDWKDDQLIASALDYSKTHGPVKIISLDTGLRLKCRDIGVECIALPEKYILEPETDESQKTIKKLEQQLREIQSAIPELKLSMAKSFRSVKNLNLSGSNDKRKFST